MDAVVLGAVNASTPTMIDTETLAAALDGRTEMDPWLGHLVAFFTELPLEAIEAFAFEHGISTEELRRAYNVVTSRAGEGSSEIDDWLGYLETAAP